jgi:hypothetical protein
MATLEHSYDPDKDQITIEGIHYSGSMFRDLGGFPIGEVIEIVEREDGVLTVKRYEPEAST